MQCHHCCYVTLVEWLNIELNGLVDVAPGGGEPRTFVSVSFHGSDLFLLPHLIGVHVMLFHKHLLTNIVKRIF